MNEQIKLTAIIEKSDDGWFVGQVEELPAAISQGRTITELKDNLAEAVKLLVETNRELIEKENEGKTVTKEHLFVAI
ncbi:MAG TPA: type II toxin-antitoxin system HicB family antitoxin [Segetibacter sp.]|jgi:predicted RNase H-like HicB family nuclease